MKRSSPALLLAAVVGFASPAFAARDPDPYELGEAAAKATEAGDHEGAMRLYRQAIDVRNAGKSGGYDQRTTHAYLAGMAAVRAGDHPAAVAFFREFQSLGTTWVKDRGGELVALVERYAAAPDDVGRRIELAEKLWLGTGLGYSGSHPRDAVKLLAPTLDRPAGPTAPSPDQRVTILLRLIECHTKLEAWADATAVADRLARTGPTDDRCGNALFTLSAIMADRGKLLAESAAVAAIVADGTYPPPSANRARYQLADLCERRGDEAGQIRHLEALAGDPADTKRDPKDFTGFRDMALARLGQVYQSKGRYDIALKYFRAWQGPRMGCGNGMAQVAYDRDMSIAECLVALGRTDEAMANHVRPYLGGPPMFFGRLERAPALAVKIHAAAGTLTAFRAEMAAAAAGKPGLAKVAMGLADVELWRQAKDVDALVGELKHVSRLVPNVRGNDDEWQARAAAEALSGLGKPAADALRAKLESLRPATAYDPASYGQRLWLLHALGACADPSAEAYLNELLAESQRPSDRRPFVSSDDVRQALALRQKKQP